MHNPFNHPDYDNWCKQYDEKKKKVEQSNHKYLETTIDLNPHSVPVDNEAHLYQDCIFIDGEAYDLNDLPF